MFINQNKYLNEQYIIEIFLKSVKYQVYFTISEEILVYYGELLTKDCIDIL